MRGYGSGSETLLTYPLPEVRLSGGQAAYLHRDQVGSIQLVTDGAGADGEHVTYQPFGEARTVVAGTIPAETKGFVGERYDAAPELQYLNARYYDPELSLFVSPDWLEVTDPGVGTNRYAYAGNSPVNQADPSGNVQQQWSDGSQEYFSPDTDFHQNTVGGGPGAINYQKSYLSGYSASSGMSMADYSEGGTPYSGGSPSHGSGSESLPGGHTGSGGGLFDLAGKIWALPNTAIGLVVGSFEYGAGLILGADPSVTFGNNAIQFLGTPFGDPAGAAITLGNVQIFHNLAPDSVVPTYRRDAYVLVGPHEEGHTYQSQALGPFFLPAYMLSGGISKSNPFENSADNYGRGVGGIFSAFGVRRY